MAEAWLPLGRFVGKLDFSGTAPPWPLLVWNPTTAAWEAVGSAAIYAPLCTGSLVPELIGTGDGQHVLVQVA